MLNLIDPPRVFRKRRNSVGTSIVGLIGLGAFLTVAGLLFLTTGQPRRVQNSVLTRPEKTAADTQEIIREENHDPDQIVDGFPAAYQKVQLSDWPSLRAFHHINLLTKKETEYIIELAAAHLARSQVVGTPTEANNGGGVISDVRTSQGMFLQSYEHRSDPVVRAFRDRISGATGFPERNMEATQVLRYQGGEFYRTHPDYFDMDVKELEKRGGNRVCTVLCYLNTPEAGGATTFPAVNVTVPAVAGNCVEFYSMKSDGSPDPLSWHGALPPGQGAVKWSMPTWIRASEFR